MCPAKEGRKWKVTFSSDTLGDNKNCTLQFKIQENLQLSLKMFFGIAISWTKIHQIDQVGGPPLHDGHTDS